MEKYHQKPNIYPSEVSINVTDLETSLSFYKEVIGFKVLLQTDKKIVLTADGTKPLLTIEQPDNVNAKEKGTTGLYHFALLLPDRKALSSFLKNLIALNIGFGSTDHSVSEALYINDPDGNGIEVYCDRPSVNWQWISEEVLMDSKQLDLQDLLKESDEEWTHLPEQTIIGHIHLQVSDLDETEQFYMKGLGFDVATRLFGATFMSTGGYHHHLGCNIWSGIGARAPKENSVGLNWYSLVLADEDTRLKVVGQLQSLGAKVEKEDDYYLTSDPSGNKIRLVI